MAHIDDLDNNILWRILMYVISIPLSSTSYWSDYLPLITTCAKWHDLLISQFYKVAFIEFTYMSESPPADYSPFSNMGLILKNGNHHYVKHLRIIINGNCDFYFAMNYVLSNYLSKIRYWPSVYHLYINFDDRFHSKAPTTSVSSANTNAINKCVHYATEFINKISNVEKLMLTIADSIPHIFASTLVAAYSRRLQNLVYFPAVFPKSVTYFPEMLTGLRLKLYDKHFNHFPTVFPESLSDLYITGLPYNFSFCHFAHNDRITNVYFNNLKTMHLEYQENVDYKLSPDNAAGFNNSYCKKPYHCNIFAPKLYDLTLSNLSPYCDILYALPKFHLDNLEIRGTVQAMAYLATLPLKIKSILSIGFILDNATIDQEFYEVTNFFVQSSNAGYKLTYTFYGQRLYLDLRNLEWHHISNLYINTPISIDSILQMLKKIKTILGLCIYDLISDSIHSTLIQFNIDLDKEILPLSAKVAEILIKRRAHYNSVTHQQMVDFIAYLMTAIPLIKNFTIDSEFADDVKAYVDLNSSRYPYLKYPNYPLFTS